MNYDRLWDVAERARSSRRLTSDDLDFLTETVPRDLASFPRTKPPVKMKHPAGFAVSGAPVGTFLRSALLIAGQKAFGKRYEGAPFYEGVERDFAMRIMRSNFQHGYPKGAHCCAQCTLAVLPVLDANAIRYFDCAELAKDVRQLVLNGEWRFATPPNAKMRAWALGE